MPTELDFADILQEFYDTKKTGALYVRIVETSEDLYRLFFKDGKICHVRYGSARARTASTFSSTTLWRAPRTLTA
jgi:hypothetical protein